MCVCECVCVRVSVHASVSVCVTVCLPGLTVDRERSVSVNRSIPCPDLLHSGKRCPGLRAIRASLSCQLKVVCV